MVPVSWFDGRTSRRTEAVLLRGPDRLVVRFQDSQKDYPLETVRVDQPLGSAPRRVDLPDGSFCEVLDHAGLEALLRVQARPGLVPRLERAWGMALVALTVTILLVVGGYFWALPWAAEKAAWLVPEEWNRQLGSSALDLLDRVHARPSTLPQARQETIRQSFVRLTPPSTPAPAWTLHFRDLGDPPNAFALPSGDIVVTDALVRAARTDGEITAVLAHELGHVALRHGLRRLMQSLGVSLTVAALTGDFSDLAAHASGLLELTYSRDMEWEADAYAIRMLRTNHLSPTLLAQALETLRDTPANATSTSDLPTILSTHPDLNERIHQASQAGRD